MWIERMRRRRLVVPLADISWACLQAFRDEDLVGGIRQSTTAQMPQN